jgi:hypothetical protein
MQFGDCRRDHLTAGTAKLRIQQNVAAIPAKLCVLEHCDEANADDCQAHEEVGPADAALWLSVVLGHADASRSNCTASVDVYLSRAETTVAGLSARLNPQILVHVQITRYGTGMTPHDVATDNVGLLRFRDEVVYLDRMRPPQDEVDADAQLLTSKVGVLIVAWLWPSPSYDPGFDPFGADPGAGQVLLENAVRHPTPVSEEKPLEAARLTLDRQRRKRLRVAARRFAQIIELTARAVDRSVKDIKTHLEWSVPVTPLELGRLLHGHTPFPFPLIVVLCRALQLEFTDAWTLVDPQSLARNIDQSVRSSDIRDHLRSLTMDDLESVQKKLPPSRPANVGPDLAPDIYHAPKPGGRYWSLYEALAADARDSPDYTIAEIDRLLIDAGEAQLPDSARKSDRSWWAGNGAKAEGRPQVSAWWAAGYRIRNIEIDPSSDQVASVGFEALSGRAEWHTNPKRTVQREYRVPGPEKLEIYRHEHDLTFAHLGQWKWRDFQAAIGPTLEVLEAWRRSSEPGDPDIRQLVEFLDKIGEADRSQIESDFNQTLEKPVAAAWMTNLLTRARRQGWTVNNGTRSRPRWASTRWTALRMEDIADNLNLAQAPAIDRRDGVPLDFLRLVAEAVGVDSANSSAPQIARRIIESLGGTWQPEFESADKSVTGLGLKAIGDAIPTRMPPEDEIITM